MEVDGREESSNVDDRRGITGGHVAVGGGIWVFYLSLPSFFWVEEILQIFNP